jgi:nicotine blue oxidoreductase
LILAAGRGTRMGGPKALMTVNGRPWWITQCERLASADVAPVWIVSPSVRAAMMGELVQQAHCPPRFVEGLPELPMLDSIRRGILSVASWKPRGVFILPVDVPAPAPEVWNVLIAHAQPGQVAVPEFRGKRGHPIYLTWPFATTVAQSHDLTQRLDHLIAGHTEVVSVQDQTVAINLNTPSDLHAWESSQETNLV